MTEQLQGLLDRIQKDGVEKAEAEARKIVEDAERKAADTTAAAEKRAAEIVKQAEVDGQAFAERGKVALQQAARDVIISVGEALNGVLQGIVTDSVKQALDTETVGRMLEAVARAYAEAAAGRKRLDVLVPTDQQEALQAYVMRQFSDALRDGIAIKGDGRVLAGFRVRVEGDSVEHDFSESAISEALSALLRPHLAAVVRDALPKS